jgi:CRP-like cAMP-binding protein
VAIVGKLHHRCCPFSGSRRSEHDLRTIVVRHEQALFAQAQQLAACNASHQVEARLARWLLRAHDLCGSESMPLTQELLSQMIGVQRNAVSISATRFSRPALFTTAGDTSKSQTWKV